MPRSRDPEARDREFLDAITEFRLRAQNKGLSPERTEELYLQALADSASKDAELVREESPADLAFMRKERDAFEGRLRDRWGAAFDLYEITLAYCHDAGSEFNTRYLPEAQREGDRRFDAARRLHARACVSASEVMRLLTGGYPMGALARSRTLQELAVVAAILVENDSEISERYLLHATIDDAAYVRARQKHTDALGLEPLPPEQVSSIEESRAELLERFGKVFDDEYGWAASLFPNRQRGPKYADLEALAAHGHMRPLYKEAAQSLHAGAAGTAAIVLTRGRNTVLLSGQTNRWLSAPGHRALISLVQVTFAFLLGLRDVTPEDGGSRQLTALTALKLSEMAGDAFAKAERQLEKDERAIQAEEDDASSP